MLFSRTPGAETAALLLLFLTIPTTHCLARTTTNEMTCQTPLLVDGNNYDLGPLRGPHSVVTSEFDALAAVYRNTSYTLDLCDTLKRTDKSKKGCPVGTRVCAITHAIEKDDPTKDFVEHVVPIAGELQNYGGQAFEWKAERLPTSDAPGNQHLEGLRLSLSGGVYQKRKQRAVVELRCDHNLTGTEGEVSPEDKYSPAQTRKRDGEADQGWSERQTRNSDGPQALIWEKYEEATDHSEKVLYLTWHTKSACATATNEPGQKSRHWGFFTWLVILVFLATASYIIFGSWLNFTRYGARGWDLLPHGDTIRDIPYLLKDWMRRFLNTMQSSGSRGGYSAV